MNSEIKICQNCKNKFTIEPEDFEFYEKIKVPAPTFCPECRMQRRLSWRNEKFLYRRKCDACSKDIISIYHQDSPYTVYCQKCWWSDDWDPLAYGRKYDFSKPFFVQFNDILKSIPRLCLINANSVNSEYTHLAADSKDCYLLFESSNNERCDYSYWMQQSNDCVDCSFVNNSELCYETLITWNCYKLFYSKECRDCSDGLFLLDCVGCSDCYGCVGLRNKKYHIFNQSYLKEEYFKILEEKKKELFEGGIDYLREEFNKFALQYRNKYAYIQKAVDSSGNYLLNVKNCKFCFHGYDAEECKYGYHVWRNSKDNMDVCTVGRDAQLIYETINTGMSIYDVKFGIQNWNGNNNLQYSEACSSSQNLFGCSALRSKQYCILNKQYSKKDYELLMGKIIKHMEEAPYVNDRGHIYKYGEFFPLEFSFFAYNETSANDHFPLSKEIASKNGYRWKEKEQRNISPTLNYSELSKYDKDIPDSLVSEIISCGNGGRENYCTVVFKFIPRELQFYKKMGLPLPRLCPNCRHYQRIKQRNPLKLWHRQCQCQGQTGNNSNNPNIYQNTIAHTHGNQPCPNEFETTYAPDRPEIVYCEQCYQQEVV